MKLTAIAAVLCLAASGYASAQVVNDVGRAAESIGPFVVGSPQPAGAVCPPPGGVAASFTGTNTQSGRIFRDAIASTCPSKVYPGIFNAGTTYNFEAFSYTNTSGAAACVTVNFNPDAGATPCGTNAHASAYIGSYDPANQATNFVGDVGSSIAQPFSFSVPAGQDAVIVVTNTSAQAACTFAFDVVNLPCSAVTAAAVPAPVNNPLSLVLLGLALVGIGAYASTRRV